jgi:hypothetical protein
MEEKQPLAYFVPGKGDAEDPHLGDRRMTFIVLSVGAAMLLTVFTLPPLISMLSPSATRPPLPSLSATPQGRNDDGGAKILMALEAYREERGGYPATLDQLSPSYLTSRADQTKWMYAPSDDQSDYQLHYTVGSP